MTTRPALTRTLAEDLARRAGNQAACRVLARDSRTTPWAPAPPEVPSAAGDPLVTSLGARLADVALRRRTQR